MEPEPNTQVDEAELDAQDGELLPSREAMSVIQAPGDVAPAAATDPADLVIDPGN